MNKKVMILIVSVIVIFIIVLFLNNSRKENEKNKNNRNPNESSHKNATIENSTSSPGFYDVYDSDGNYVTSFEDEEMIGIYIDNPYYNPW